MFTLSRVLFCSSLVALVTHRALGQNEGADIAKVLMHYRESLSYLGSVSLRVVTTVDSTAGGSDLFPQTLDFVFRHDRETNRAEWIGKLLIHREDGTVDPVESKFIKDVADGDMFASLEYDRLVEEGDFSRRAILWHNYTERLRDLYENPNYGGPLFGSMYGTSRKSVSDLLEASPDLHVRREEENINGVPCVVLEGTSQYGKVTAWIAPEKGHNAMKWTIEKYPHHFFNDTVLSTKWPAFESSHVTFEVKKLQETADGGSTIIAPALAMFTHTTNMHDGTKNVDRFEYVVSSIQMRPDFTALGAFKIELPDGIRVFDRDIPSIRFKWENGRPVAIVDRGFLADVDKEIGRLQTEDEAESATSSVRQAEAVPKGPVLTGRGSQSRSASKDYLIWGCVVAGVAIVGVVGWLVLRRCI